MNLKKLLPLLPLIVLLLVGCQQEPVNLDVEKSDLMRTDNEFAHLSAEKGASVAFRAYVSEDAILMPDRGHPIQGRDAIYEWMKGGDEVYSLVWEVLGVDVAKSAEMGWTWGEWRFTGPNQAGETVQAFGNYLFVWKKISGKWKVVADIRNPNPPPEQP